MAHAPDREDDRRAVDRVIDDEQRDRADEEHDRPRTREDGVHALAALLGGGEALDHRLRASPVDEQRCGADEQKEQRGAVPQAQAVPGGLGQGAQSKPGREADRRDGGHADGPLERVVAFEQALGHEHREHPREIDDGPEAHRHLRAARKRLASMRNTNATLR